MGKRVERGSDRVDDEAKLKADATLAEASGLNVHGKETTQPSEAFGWLWRKTYLVENVTGKSK